jgi:hypothetical protein
VEVEVEEHLDISTLLVRKSSFFSSFSEQLILLGHVDVVQPFKTPTKSSSGGNLGFSFLFRT